MFTILDTVSGVATDYSVSSPLTGRPRLNSDGTKLYFTETYRLMVHEFKDGKPTGITEVGKLGFWNKWLGSGMGNHFDRPEPLQNPNWIVTNFNDKKGLHLYDCSSGRL